jgi:ribosomal protein S12 methylthiotransferase accessory factor YcaO
MECYATGIREISSILENLPSQYDWTSCWSELGLPYDSNSIIPTVNAVAFPGNIQILLPRNHVAMSDLNYGFTDTSGCAAHKSSDFAIHNAFSEFLERQYLVAAWLTGTCEFRIDVESVFSLVDSQTRSIIKWLTQSGDLSLICLCNSGEFFVVIAIHVHVPVSSASAGFSCGCGGSASQLEAIGSAIRELFAGLIFDLCTGVLATTPAHSYEANAQQFTEKTYRDLLPDSWLNAKSLSLGSVVSESPVHESTCLDKIVGKEGRPYAVYCEKSRMFPEWWVAKIVSPSYFVNIDTSGAINIKNKFFLDYLVKNKSSTFESIRRTPICLP